MRSLFSIVSAATCGALLLAACNGSKSLAKKAAQLEAGGMYAEAADMYLQSVQRSNTNVDAKIGLKKNGQQLLNDKLSTFWKSVNAGGQKGEAVDAYLAAKAYSDKVGRLGVQLEIPENYTADFNKVKSEYVLELYEKGQAMLENKDYANAEKVFARIGELEPGYKDTGSLQAVAYLEPLYRSGKDALAAGQYRKAYGDLGKVTAKDATYKDAAALRKESVEKGRYTIAVLPFTGNAKQKALNDKLLAYATTALTEVNDPFLKVVDRENLQRILDEQRLGLSGVVDEQTAVNVGNLMGAKAVLMGTLIDYREETGTLKTSTKSAFESYRVRQLNKETNTYETIVKYRPVKYTEHLQENKVVLSFSYKIVSLETGEVLFSKVVDATKDDHMYYASYDGDKNSLLPAGQNGTVDPNDAARRNLVQLLNAPREIKPTATLGSDALREGANNMAATIQAQVASIQQ